MSLKSRYKIRVITKLPNTEQSSKGKGKTQVKKQTKSDNNRKTGKTAMTLTCYRHFQRNGGFNSDFTAPNLPLPLRLKGSGCHYNSIFNNAGQIKYNSSQCSTL
jgi:hypothetical protein